MLKALRDQPEPDRQALAELEARRNASIRASSDKVEAGLKKILDRRQFTRLEQIRYQTEGPKAFERPEVQERLNVSPEQVELIMTIIAQGERELVSASLVPVEVAPDFRNLTPEQRRASMETAAYKGAVKKFQESGVKVRGETMRMISKALTKGQRERYEKMVGEPFDFRKVWNGPKSGTPEAGKATTSR
jgi:hypothetical protein